MPQARTTWTLSTPAGAGAVAIVQLSGDVDAALRVCGIGPVAAGQVRLCDLLGIDRGIVARFGPDLCQLMPHGGVAVVRALLRGLSARGIQEDNAGETDWFGKYPEARSEVEARALAMLSVAASPLAVDLLLAQHDRWSEPGGASDAERDRILNRLIVPPLVVALGASNIGKSTLVNALAGRSVSIVADEPGTTRDHVGVLIDLAGLVVRYVDTPGLRDGAGAVEADAVERAMEIASRADLLVLCGDANAGLPALPPELAAIPRIRVALRSDLGTATFASDAAVSVVKSKGIAELVAIMRESLVPTALTRDPRPWRFW